MKLKDGIGAQLCWFVHAEFDMDFNNAGISEPPPKLYIRTTSSEVST